MSSSSGVLQSPACTQLSESSNGLAVPETTLSEEWSLQQQAFNQVLACPLASFNQPFHVQL